MKDRKISCFLLGMCLVSATMAGTWTFQVPFDIVADLKNDGTLVKATNFGNPSTTATVNGILFDTNWSNTNADSLFNSTTSYYAGSDAEIAKLMNQSAQNYTWEWSEGTRQFDITLSNLEIGHVYRIQILTAGVGWHGNDFFVNDWTEYEWFYVNEGDLILATYIWTADVDTITVTNHINWGSGDGAVDVMGYAVHEIARAYAPDPVHNAFVSADLSQLSWSIPDPNISETPITSYVYFGSTNPADTDYYIAGTDKNLPAFGLKPIASAQHISLTSIPVPVSLSENTEYYWVVDCNDISMSPPTLAGDLWKFSTATYEKMAHWNLDGLVGGQYEDSSGKGHHADPNGVPQFFAAPDAVKGNAVLIVDPNNGPARAGTWNPSAVTNQFTVSGWLKCNNPVSESTQGIVTKHNGWAQETTLWQIVVNPSGQLQILRAGGGSVSSIDLPADEWVFMAATFKTNIVTFYTYRPNDPDDDLNFTQHSGSFTFGTKPDATLNIGCSFVDSQGVKQEAYDGFLDEIQIFNYALDQTEIADLYNEGYAKSFCVAAYNVGFDVSGPEGISDCLIDIYDFADFAANWLTSGLYPVIP